MLLVPRYLVIDMVRTENSAGVLARLSEEMLGVEGAGVVDTTPTSPVRNIVSGTNRQVRLTPQKNYSLLLYIFNPNTWESGYLKRLGCQSLAMCLIHYVS